MNETKPAKAFGVIQVTPGGVSPTGKEKWHLQQGHEPPVTIVTSGTSAAAMDKAVTTFDEALKRLAKR